MFTFQSFKPTDKNYTTFTAIHNAVYPDSGLTAAACRYDDAQRNPAYHKTRDFILKDGVPIGCGEMGEAFWFGTSGTYWMHICVHPDHRGQGAAAAWYPVGEQKIVSRGGKQIMAETLESCVPAMQMLKRRGFEQKMRYPRSRIDFRTLDFDALPDPTAKLADDGIIIVSLNQMKERYSDWLARAVDISNDVGLDVPRTGEYQPIPLRDFKALINHPHSDLNGWFHAIDTNLDGDEVIGITSQRYNPDDPHKVRVGMTGVRRAYRRRGVATALKLAAMRYAKSVGGHTMDTDNEENNPMYALNLRLGFEPLPANIEFKKVL